MTVSEITAHFDQSIELLSEIEKIVGKNDPICENLAAVLGAHHDAFNNMANLIEKGKRISTLPMEKFQL